jgi:hypothetical protein
MVMGKLDISIKKNEVTLYLLPGAKINHNGLDLNALDLPR